MPIRVTDLPQRAPYQAQYAGNTARVPRYDAQGALQTAQGVADLGQGLEQAGQALGKYAQQEQREEITAQLAQADAGSYADVQALLSEVNGHVPDNERQWISDPSDYDGIIVEADARLKSIKSQYLQGFQSEKAGSAWAAAFDKMAANAVKSTVDRSHVLRRDKRRAEVAASMDTIVTSLGPFTTQEMFDNAVERIGNAVTGAVGNGVYSREEGQAEGSARVGMVRTAQVRTLIDQGRLEEAKQAANDLPGLLPSQRSQLAAKAEKAAADQQVDDAYASLNGLASEDAVKRISAIQGPDVKQRVARRWSTDFELQRTVQAEQQKREQEAAREQIYAGIRGDAITAKDIESFESVLPAGEIQGFLDFAQKRANTAQTTEARTAKAGAELRLTVAKLNGQLDYEALGKELSNLDTPGLHFWSEQVQQEKTAAQKQDAKDKESAVSRAEARSVASEMMQGAKISQKKDPELWSKVLRRVDAMIDRGGWKSFDELEKAIQHELDMGVIRDSGFLRDDRVRRVEARQPDGALNPDWYLEPDDAGEQRTKDLLRSSGLPTDENSIEDAYTYMQAKYGDAWPKVDEAPAGTGKPDANTPVSMEPEVGEETNLRDTGRTGTIIEREGGNLQ